jgi:hypothetical protein
MSWFVALSLVGALALGIWIGLPRRYEQPLDDIDRRLGEDGEHERVKRHATFINFIQRKIQKGSDRRRRARKPFQMR